jgi:putative restriction endonuclease
VKAYVGVTDGDWYRYLASREVDEVNFWRPSGGRGFHVLAVGEPFFFKSHAPDNRIVGGGFYSGFATLRLSEAWNIFREANGAASFEQMRHRISRYRAEPIAAGEDPSIGCLFVRDVRFFVADPADPPPDFAPNIVQGKGYDLSDSYVEAYFRDLLRRVVGLASDNLDLREPWHLTGDTYGDPRLAPRRLGQKSFQAVLMETYHGRCAITGAKIRPVLQAAHIVPLPKGGQHRTDNGLLLRSDVHTLYDRWYLGVDLKHRLLVSPRLRTEFGNGEQFYEMAGEQIALPAHRVDRPHKEFLEWHLDTVFHGA